MTANAFRQGPNNTLEIQNTKGFLYSGNISFLFSDTVIDRWHVGSNTGVEYTISVEYNSDVREILKCLIIAGLETASINVFSRVSTAIELVDVSAIYNSSYVDVILNPKTSSIEKSTVTFFANYFPSNVAMSV